MPVIPFITLVPLSPDFLSNVQATGAAAVPLALEACALTAANAEARGNGDGGGECILNPKPLNPKPKP